MPEQEQEVVFRPEPGPQTLLLSCPAPEIFFGGARGGGKTFGMIGHFLQHERRYGKDAEGLWLRQTFPEIQKNALKAMRKVFPHLGAVYNAQPRCWVFPSGATLTLGYLESVKDAGRYQGQEYTVIYVDEAAEWPSPEPIDMLRGSLRSPAGVPTQMVMTGNPGGAGHAWCQERFIDPAPPMTPIEETFTHPITGEEVTTHRVFIPSFLEDNSFLRNDAGYVAGLHQVGNPYLVLAWLTGDWTAKIDGEAIRVSWFKRYKTPPARFDVLIDSWDTAETDGKKSAFTARIVAGLAGRRLYILHVEIKKVLFPELCQWHREAARCETYAGQKYTPVGVSVIEEKSSGVQLLQTIRYDNDPDSPDGWPATCNYVGWNKGTQKSKAERIYNEAGTVEAGNVYLPYKEPWLSIFETSVGLAPSAPKMDIPDAFSQLLCYVRTRFARFSYSYDANGKAVFSSPPTDLALPKEKAPPPPPPEDKLKNVDQGEQLWAGLSGLYGR